MSAGLEVETLEWRVEEVIIDFLKGNAKPQPKGGFRHRDDDASDTAGDYAVVGCMKVENDPEGTGWWKLETSVDYRHGDTLETDEGSYDAKECDRTARGIDSALDCMDATDLRVAGSHQVAKGFEYLETEREEDDGIRSRKKMLNIWAGLVQP